MQHLMFCYCGPVCLGCLFAVPATHLYGLCKHCPSSAQFKHILMYPFTGGKRHMVFQLFAWTIWFLSSVSLIPMVLPEYFPSWHLDTLFGPAMVAAVVGELFMLKSLMVFDPSQQHQELRAHKPVQLVFSNPLMASYTVMVMGCALSLLGGVMLFIVEHLPDSRSRSAYIVAAMICVVISSTSTHGLGGFLRHAKTRRGWRFYQPFHGGTLFVATQFTGWMLFSLSCIGLMRILLFLMSGVAYCIRCWSTVIFFMMLGSQAFLALSLLTYNQKKPTFITFTHHLKKPRLGPLHIPRLQFDIVFPILLLYIPAHMVCLAVIILYCVTPIKVAHFVTLMFFIPYYLITRKGQPEHNGNRKWQKFCDFCSNTLPVAFREWYGGLNVVRCAALNPHDRHIFCYHPHGLYPAGAAYLKFVPEFKQLFPGIQPATLTASVMHYVPLIKEMCCWTGVRSISKPTFLKALQEEGSVLICPGGQEELIESYKAYAAQQEPEVVLCKRHKGFCRVAIEQQAKLVPILPLGEVFQMRNFITWPWMQNMTYKILGFPIPYFIVGRWKITPFPRNVPVVFVVGEPISPPEFEKGKEAPQSMVVDFHQKYYESVRELFNQYKDLHPHYKTTKLVFKEHI